jgi:hypothetical protein
MIDRHYGHLARDGLEHAIKLLDTLDAPDSERWTLVDARWTPNQKKRRQDRQRQAPDSRLHSKAL